MKKKKSKPTLKQKYWASYHRRKGKKESKKFLKKYKRKKR